MLLDIQHFGGINSSERIDHHVAHGLTVRAVVEKSKSCDRRHAMAATIFADTPELQIGPTRQIDVTVAETPCRVGEYCSIRAG